MVNNKQIDFPSYNPSVNPVYLDVIQRTLVGTSRLFKINTTAYKLDYFERMLNYLRIIGLYVLSNNQHIKLVDPALQKKLDATYEERIIRSLTEFLVHFGVVLFQERVQVINSDYISLLKDNRIESLVKNKQNLAKESLTGKEKSMIRDFHFVNDLVLKYNNPGHQFQHIKQGKSREWETLVMERKLDYEIRLSETLYNLVNLKIPRKIESPFDEDYYTESGQNAFKNYTQFRFPGYLKQITANKEKIKVFDLGCGYGNYVDIVYRNFPDAFITGIEKNPKVFSDTSEKFSDIKNVEIINDDFFRYEPDKEYDIILMNYVLFYFNFSGKKRIIEKAKNMLTSKGSIVLCQYFSGIEALKENIAKVQNDYSAAKKIEMYYSNKILYANILWNDAVDTFSEAVKWNEFKTIVS